MTRPAVLLVALVAAVALALGGGSPNGSSAPARGEAASTRLLGVTGDAARFKDQTGQASRVVQAFLGWGQGQSYGSPFAALLPTLAPIPLLHLGTGGSGANARKEVMTPGAIAAGKGDGYLIALADAIAGWAKGIYVRPLAEMNNAGSLWSGYRADGTPKDANHSPTAYRKAFARIYLILHGGSASSIDAKLRALRLPPLPGGDVPTNPFPRLRVVWSPLASDNPRVPGNAAQHYYPGSAYVDVEGGDIYDERPTDTAPWPGLEALYRAAVARGEPFAVPEFGLIGVDDPAFVRHMCAFVATHGATEMLAFYDSKPGSPSDLGTKPGSRAAYSRCLTPLAGGYPAWAASNEPGAGPRVVRLTLTPAPPSGPSPLDVQFAVDAKLSVAIIQWRLYFGDGLSTGGAGPPPVTVAHTYAQDAVYHATLIVYSSPPFDPAAARFLAVADVAVGTGPQPIVDVKVTPGSAPLALTVQIDLRLPQPATSWQLAWGDGKSDQGTGKPPHFTGHTYARPGMYRAVLIVRAPSGSYLTANDVSVAASAAPPASGTPTGTVLVDGRPFTGGTIPYGSRVDVTKGRLQLHTDRGNLLVYGNGVSAAFLLLRGKDSGKPIVELRLVGGNFGLCTRSTAAVSTKSKRVIRQLWGSGKGSFRTRGRYSSATVRGTIWLTADRCDGTLTKVQRGIVQVLDVVKHRRVLVRAGRSYLALKP